MNPLQIVKNYEFSTGLDPERYDYELVNGRGRYNRVVASDKGSRRAVAFVNKVTGSIFKAASWSQPA